MLVRLEFLTCLRRTFLQSPMLSYYAEQAAGHALRNPHDSQAQQQAHYWANLLQQQRQGMPTQPQAPPAQGWPQGPPLRPDQPLAQPPGISAPLPSAVPAWPPGPTAPNPQVGTQNNQTCTSTDGWISTSQPTCALPICKCACVFRSKYASLQPEGLEAD